MAEKGHPLPELWRSRHLVHGRITITRRPFGASGGFAGWIASAGRAWRRLPRWSQWALAIVVFAVLQNVAAPGGVVFGVLLLVLLAVTDPATVAKRPALAGSPEARLAASNRVEAKVAGAACRAWDETTLEPSWSSPALTTTRATFDGRQEVDTVVHLAYRIHQAREQLGDRPTGPAADLWQQQWNALDNAALRLGDRADALIRYRDQAALLSAELAQLAELERLERSALVVDDLTIETASVPTAAGYSPVSEQILAARQTVGELIDLMNRTRAPLTEPTPAEGL